MSLFLASENGKLYDGAFRVLGTFSESLMGLAARRGRLYVAGKSFIVGAGYEWHGPRVDFHEMTWHNDKLYVTCTAINEIWAFTPELELVAKYAIAPPCRGPVQRGKNYNHINALYRAGAFWYVALNWFTCRGISGVAKLTHDFQEVSRRPLGWQQHALQRYTDSVLYLCSSTVRRPEHPHETCIFLGRHKVFSLDADAWFLKGFHQGYACGGNNAPRGARKAGLVVKFARDFRVLAQVVSPVGAFNGVRKFHDTTF